MQNSDQSGHSEKDFSGPCPKVTPWASLIFGWLPFTLSGKRFFQEGGNVILALGILVIGVAVYAIYLRFDVRLVLFLAAVFLGALAGGLPSIFETFFRTFSNERFVVPICCAMGFAYVLRHTGCDQHLVHLLIEPLKKVRWALIPGTVLVGFLVNIPIISQTSTAATLGPVVIPILRRARISMATIGATLVLGCSIGGELLNPGAPELRTIAAESDEAAKNLKKEPPGLSGTECVNRIFPLDMLGLVVALAAFWWMSNRAEAKEKLQESETKLASEQEEEEPEGFRVNLVKAAIPLLPLVLLFLTGPPLNLVKIWPGWLVEPTKKDPVPVEVKIGPAVNPSAGFPGAVPVGFLAAEIEEKPEFSPEQLRLFNSRLIGAAMLVGVIVAALVSWKSSPEVPRAFFEGAGYAFGAIVSLIVTANCFGAGIRQIGIADLIGDAIQSAPWMLLPLSGSLPLGFAALSGSGMATTQSLFEFFAGPALEQNVDPSLVGAVVALASAAGRTMSPVAAVVLMSSTLTNTNPFELAKRVALPLILGVAVIVVAAVLMAS